MDGRTTGQRVLLVHQFFAPDVTTYAQMLDAFATKLAADGHDVTVVCGPPTYNGAYDGPSVPRREKRDGFEVHRLRVPGTETRLRKALATLLFPLAVVCFAWLRRRPFTVVSVSTIPPVLMGAAGRLAAARSRRGRFVYHCMDLYPEAAQALGVKPNGWLSRVARAVDNATISAARPAIVLSEDMKHTLDSRGAETGNVVVSNNFIVHSSGSVSGTGHETETLRLVFAGNIGRFQGLGLLVDGVAEAHRRGLAVHLHFLGNGAMASDIRNRTLAEALPIDFSPHQPIEQAAPLMAAADFGVVSLAPDVIRSAYPSKTMMYLELGLPLLAVVEHDSELSRLISKHGIGIVCQELTADAVAGAIARARDSAFDRADIQRTGRELFGRDAALRRWAAAYGLAEAAA